MDITIIGYGKLGRALALENLKQGNLYAIVSQHLGNTTDGETFRKENVLVVQNLEDLPGVSDVIFICAADRDIPKVAQNLAQRFGKALESKVIIHCSGSYSDKILEDLKRAGSFVASAHPLQTFYFYRPDIFQNIFWIVQTESFEKIEGVLRKIGGTPIQVEFDDRQRAIYHASAVVSSNYLNTLILFAKKLIAQIPFDPKVFIPLIQQTLENNFVHFSEPNFLPLTGPLVRKDLATIEEHLKSLDSKPELQQIYLEFAKITLLLCREIEILTENEFKEIVEKLKVYKI
jgi:predicted short-subunit dehydrogenase-like oxidoreductase (DUF2520 family)